MVMKMNDRLREALKSAAIIALAVNAVFLAYKSEVFNEFLASSALAGRINSYLRGDDGSGGGSGGTAASASVEAARPAKMAVVNDNGMRCAQQYDSAALDYMFEKTANVFGEALGSAAAAEKCEERDWRRALRAPGIYLDYEAELPISALTQWLGVSAASENARSASHFAVVVESGASAVVYYTDGEEYYRSESAAPVESMRQVMSEFLPNGAYFAFESAACGEVAPYTLIFPKLGDRYAVTVESTTGYKEIREHTAEALGMNILGGASYTEKNGTMVFVGSGGILKMRQDGEINYSSTDYGEQGDGRKQPSDAELIDRSLALIADICAGYTGCETVRFTDIKTNGDGTRTLSFEYYIDGARVVQKSGSAAMAVFENDRLVYFNIWLRRYELTDEKVLLLPQLQAAAIAGGVKSGSGLSLVYHDGGEEKILPAWAAV